ncbi:lyase family protein [Brevibacterium linens]|uniref:3-carboxy-cis,cis-muconate cycloisomerase n=1 Tax=Brevibacterium linens TaxID=1703 RepID=A0A0B9AQX3_BRELN|nr:lyase family protein [Brevibacterium linens]KHS53259.1 3-carboxy-cis,cis-muconate cycloisomerase [Brevibacterium linens]
MTDTAHTRFLFAPGDLRGAEAIDDSALISAIGQVETAWIVAQGRVGLVSSETRAEVAAAIDATVRSLTDDHSQLESLGEAAESGGNPVIPFLGLARERLSAEASRCLHRGLTSQDVIDTAIGLLVSRVVRQMQARLEVIGASLVELSESHTQTLCLARTLTQPALPTTFGLKAANWAAEVNEVQAQAPYVDYVQVGGAAGTRAAIRWFAGDSTDSLLREFHMQMVGPDAALTQIPVPWHTDRVRIMSWGTHLTQCVTVGASIARDVLVGVRPEIGELSLAATGGSSAMPHKSNPTSAVLLHRNGMRVPGALSTLTTAAAEAVEERSDGAWHAEWPALSELMTLAVSSLIMLDEMIAGLTVRPDAMRANLDAAGPGIFGEKLNIVFGDRLSKDQLAAITAPGTDPVAALREAVGDEDGIAEFFTPESYLGEAEDIRRTILATIDSSGPQEIDLPPVD